MRELIRRLEEGHRAAGGVLLTEGGVSWQVFGADTKMLTGKRLFKYLTDPEPRGAGYAGLKESTLEIDAPEPIPPTIGGRFMGYHSAFRCYGESPAEGGGPPESYKAWGYVFAGLRSGGMDGIEVKSYVYVKI